MQRLSSVDVQITQIDMTRYDHDRRLDINLLSQLPPQSRECIIQQFWGCDIASNTSRSLNLLNNCYFRYQEEQCRLAIYNHGRCGILATYRDLANIIRQLREENPDRESLREDLQKKFELSESEAESSKSSCDDSDDFADELIDLAVCLWLMVPVGAFRQVTLLGTSLDWRRGYLQEALGRQFEKSSQKQESVTLGKVFNAHNLERIGGLRIIWTGNLADHLRMHDDDTRVSIFHHATFLHYQKSCQIFPPGLVEETLQTLALLLPCHDKRVKKWYRKQVTRFKVDENAIKGGPLKTEDRQLDKFEYWHDRLEILKDVFDDAEPSTILQWWQDRRRRVQWYTFWVAVLVLILTIFFGLVQSIEGGFQVYKAYHPE